MENLRTFIAVNVIVKSVLKNKWYELKSLLCNDSVKWVNEHTIHLTLFFLGDTPIGQAETIAQQLELNLKNTTKFRITLNGFGFFGKNNSPNVIWVGISESQHLFQLQQKVSSTISKLGFKEPQSRFCPHLTLGRIKHLNSLVELTDYINMNKSLILQEVEVDKVFFYQSILKPNGPIYIPLKEVKLLSL